MVSVTTHGMMTVESTNEAITSGIINIAVYFTSQPKGTLFIKAQTTGESVRIPLSNLPSGSVVWTLGVDGPADPTNQWYTVEFSGKASNLLVTGSDGPTPSNGVIFDGNGMGEVSGLTYNNGL